jgi:hypothetical protein
MALICHLYGEKDLSRFYEAYIPLSYTIATSRSTFNCGSIISKQLSTKIEEAQNPKTRETPAFYMASYLLNVICARNVFPGLSIRWNISEFPVHFYFIILWENKYKRSIALICDGFICRVYSLIFKQSCPRLSEAAKKVIAKIGHWYLEEKIRYTIFFGSIGEPHTYFQSMYPIRW